MIGGIKPQILTLDKDNSSTLLSNTLPTSPNKFTATLMYIAMAN
jgi:hypothetical protein